MIQFPKENKEVWIVRYTLKAIKLNTDIRVEMSTYK